MNDAQTGTLIGGFFALTATMMGLTLRAVRAEMSVLGTRIEGLDRRMGHLDRDVRMALQRLMDG